ncbi:uncharacterized protein EURHEDRAFT_377060 [Aspergillus ruber CBS 135680]|uniref:Uncharacterized protein n=1 Tax=Aspergillus ruber (strain CBS 135680) TaxID=1388766 RepID=A0A017SH99_ASPRC|nr:uncharacterized protein EURHEDRAFT_377060 [Aspergillus ruber CBS 135680]EYE96014.1 hypothetical protein EURHEDRAFT_377060 [Aspergillus ruber CBS 135680]
MDNATRQPMEQDQIQYWPESFAIHQQQQKYPSSPLPNDHTLAHPVPKALHLQNSNFSIFGHDESNIYPKREVVSPMTGSNHSTEDLNLFNTQSSPNSSVTTFDEPCFTPMSSTFSTMNPTSWASSSLSSASSTSSSFSSQNYHHQASDAATMGTWANVPHYLQPSSHHLPQAIDATWDVAQPTNEDMMMFNGLPWLDFNTDEIPTYFTSPVPEVTDHKAMSYPSFTHQHQNIQPQPLQPQLQPHFYTTTPATTTTAAPRSTAPTPSSTRNAFLIECKRRGLSYKDIKRLGGFKEAESTLRGRFRTLTKTKEQRVRRPQWEERDIQLLCEAVSILSSERGRHTYRRSFKHNSLCRGQGCGCPAHLHTADADAGAGSESGIPKVSWKKVAGYIWLRGGSYHFGNATCKKKWCDVHNIELK